MISEIVESYRSNPEQVREAQDQFQAIMSRSATDIDFRHQLLHEPRAAMKEFTGREMSASRSIKFVESGGKSTFVLPAFVGADAQLSENELEAVSGGSTPGCAVLIIEIALLTYAILHVE